jgi:UrcA family protein
MKQTLRIILGSALVAGALIKAIPALAEPAPATINVSVVHTGDLDLSTNSGRRQLDRRLVVAVHEVCGHASDVDLVGKNAVRSCRHSVLAESRARSNALLAARGGDGTILVASSR